MNSINKYNKDISDIPLTGNPEISFFTKVYRKYTPFKIKRIRTDNVLHTGTGNKLNYHGDLIKSIDLEITNIQMIDTVPPLPDNLGTTVLVDISLITSKLNEPIETLSGSYIETYYQLNNIRPLHSFYEVDSNQNIQCTTGTLHNSLTLS